MHIDVNPDREDGLAQRALRPTQSYDAAMAALSRDVPVLEIPWMEDMMSVVQDIDKLEKEAAESLKYAEKRKAEIVAMGADVEKRIKDLGASIKHVLQAATDSQRNIESWRAQYDGFIEAMKHTMAEYPKYKKMGVEAEAFLKQLKDEKIKNDAERKKAGAQYKPTPKDQLFDAVYKKAQTAVAYDSSKSMEESVKNIKVFVDMMEASFKDHVREAKEAFDGLDNMMNSLKGFKMINKYAARPGTVDTNLFGSAFGKYFDSVNSAKK